MGFLGCMDFVGLAGGTSLERVGRMPRATKVSVQLRGIPTGHKGTAKTIQHMKEAALGEEGAYDPDVRLWAQKIVDHVPSKDYRGEVQAIDQFMRRHVRYVLDPKGLEWVQTPKWTMLGIGSGDCDDHASLVAALAVSLGHGAAFKTVAGERSRPDEWSHVYALVGYRDARGVHWIPVDSTEIGAPFGWEPPKDKVYKTKVWPVAPA